MKMSRPVSALVLGLLALPAAAIAQERMVAEQESIDAIRGEIEARQVEFVAILNGDDPAAITRFYTADAVLMPPGVAVMEGREAIGEFFGPGMGGATLDVETWDVIPQGSDVALETGGYEINASDGSHLDHGKYMVVWVRTDDGWKMKYDMWNSSMAPPEMSHEEMHERMHGDGQGHEAHEGAAHEAREDGAHEAAHVMQQKAGVDRMDDDDDGDAVPTADEDEM